MIQIDAAQSGQTLDMRVGEVAELRLAENVTTGFRWQVSRDGSPACRLTDEATLNEGAARPGQGGTHVWRITGIQPGTCDVTLSYGRPWEQNATPARSFEVRIRIAG